MPWSDPLFMLNGRRSQKVLCCPGVGVGGTGGHRGYGGAGGRECGTGAPPQAVPEEQAPSRGKSRASHQVGHAHTGSEPLETCKYTI